LVPRGAARLLGGLHEEDAMDSTIEAKARQYEARALLACDCPTSITIKYDPVPGWAHVSIEVGGKEHSFGVGQNHNDELFMEKIARMCLLTRIDPND
jgi:hypothetical protein